MTEQGSRYGGLFEDFCPGQVFKHWPGKTITESDNNLFSLLTRNDNPLHSDTHYMASHQHRKDTGERNAGLQPDRRDERSRHQRSGGGEPGVRAGDARRAGIYRGYHLWRDGGAGDAGDQPGRQRELCMWRVGVLTSGESGCLPSGVGFW